MVLQISQQVWGAQLLKMPLQQQPMPCSCCSFTHRETALPYYDGLDEQRARPRPTSCLCLAADDLMQAAAIDQQQHRLLQLPSLQQGQQESSSSRSVSGAATASCSPSHPVEHMLLALLVLEAAAKGRPYSGPIRLGLTALHGLLGNARAAGQHFTVLDVKHIQHDTLSRSVGGLAAVWPAAAACCCIMQLVSIAASLWPALCRCCIARSNTPEAVRDADAADDSLTTDVTADWWCVMAVNAWAAATTCCRCCWG